MALLRAVLALKCENAAIEPAKVRKISYQGRTMHLPASRRPSVWADWGLCPVLGWALQSAQWVQIAHRQDWMAAYSLRGPRLSQDLA